MLCAGARHVVCCATPSLVADTAEVLGLVAAQAVASTSERADCLGVPASSCRVAAVEVDVALPAVLLGVAPVAQLLSAIEGACTGVLVRIRVVVPVRHAKAVQASHDLFVAAAAARLRELGLPERALGQRGLGDVSLVADEAPRKRLLPVVAAETIAHRTAPRDGTSGVSGRFVAANAVGSGGDDMSVFYAHAPG